MTCERVEEHLSELIDNQLDPRLTQAVKEHLASCPACAQAWHELSLLVKTSSELEPLVPPDRLYWDIRRQARNVQHRPWVASLRVGWVILPTLATLALMLVLFPRKPAPVQPMTGATPQAAEATQPQSPDLASAQPEPSTPVAGAQPRATRRAASISGLRSSSRAPVVTAAAAPTRPTMTAQAIGQTAALVIPTAAVQPADLGSRPTDEVMANLRDIQQAMEEIEAALQQNPGNAQVQAAYQAAYRKGQEIRDHYLLGAR